ncbi:MAG: hypothetical protein CMO30_18050 [Tistrella sp.]|uniref:DUF6468 domain-containing protein n=1 Tax=Tistrella mobilis TaxID=171437 RepID=A0A3B9IQ23_9PROT|nr:DUF6468 domain-containing protein [Tistrella sp.]MAD39986.1 hypothetical protein [Tistrella sp.]MBA77172.1 hypothetical protein [Tistrella sp.]HAE49309.1 hypothetical protein [Tistrella mobilis]
MSFSLGMILDVTLVVLLGATIGYCVALHRRLGELRAAQSELPKLIDNFIEATRRAEAGIAGLKAASAATADEIGPKLGEAQVLREDLAFMIDHGGKLADRLEAAVRVARVEAQSRAAAPLASARPESVERGGPADRGGPARRNGAAEPQAHDFDDEDDDRPLRAERPAATPEPAQPRAQRSRAETTAAILRMLKGGD